MKKPGILIFIFLNILFSQSVTAQKDSTHFVTTWRTDSTGISNDSAIYIEVDTSFVYNFDVDWNNDGTFDTLGVSDNLLIQYSSPGTYTIRIRGTFPSTYFEPFPLTPTASLHDQKKLISIDQWGTYPWKMLAGAFKDCPNVTSSATDSPNLTSVTDLSAMFSGASSFNADLSGWDVSTITGMSWMFEGATNFNGNISNWDVSNVLHMRVMFADAINFNQDVSGWDVSSVRWADMMFSGARKFNQDISGWNVDSIVWIDGMFLFASQFNQDLSHWNIQGVSNMISLFDYSGLSRKNYDLILKAWQAKPHQLNVTLGADKIRYCLGDSSRALLIADGWSFGGDSLDCFAVGIEENNLTSNIRFYPNPASNSITIEIEQGTNYETFQIFSLTGKLVKEQQIQSSREVIEFSNLSNGIYMVKYGSSLKKLTIMN